MAELANCERCGAVYVRTIRDICNNCYQEEEKAYQTVYEFLRDRKNREATILDIVDATGVEEDLIIKFIKEKRLLPKDFPMLGYPCERCGKNITTGKICVNCQKELQSDLEVFENEIQTKQEREEREKNNIYFSIDKHKR